MGEFSRASENYESSQRIYAHLLMGDPQNINWQSGVAWSYANLAKIQQAQGKLIDALKSTRASLEIRNSLSEADPANSTWQRNLGSSYVQIAEIQEALGIGTDALINLTAALAIRSRLTKTDPNNARWQRDLWSVYWRLADYEPTVYWPKVIAKLEELEQRGTLARADHKYIAIAKEELAKLQK